MKGWGIVPLLFLISVTPVLALTLTFSHPSSTIDEDSEFAIDIQLSCQNCGDSYLRGVFYSSGTNYFGLTQNNAGEWLSTSSDKTRYFKVGESEIIDSSWSGRLNIKPDISDSAYLGPGIYFFKVGRYTSSGSVTWSEPATLAISGPTATPTRVPTSRPAPSPTATPRPTPSTKPSSTAGPTLIAEPTLYFPSLIITDYSLPDGILGAATAAAADIATPTPSLSPVNSADTPPPWPAMLLVAAGLAGILGSFTWLFFRHP